MRNGWKAAAAVVALLAVAGCQPGQFLKAAMPNAVRPSSDDARDRELRLAAAARAAGQHDAAIAIYQKLAKADPGLAEARVGIADIYFEKGAHARALATYNEALEGPLASPAIFATALTGRGRVLLATGRPEAAEADFAAALKVDPTNAIALNGLGVAADMQGRHRDAQRRYGEALAYDPGNERVRSNLGLSYALAARFDDAVAELAPIAAMAERAPKARHNLALAFGLAGQETAARQVMSDMIDGRSADGNARFYQVMRGAVGGAAQPVETLRPEPAAYPTATPVPATTATPEPAPTAAADSDLISREEAINTFEQNADLQVKTDEATGAAVFGPELNLLETTAGQ